MGDVTAPLTLVQSSVCCLEKTAKKKSRRTMVVSKSLKSEAVVVTINACQTYLSWWNGVNGTIVSIYVGERRS